MASGKLRIDPPGQSKAEPETAINEALAAVGLVATEPINLEDVFALWPENLPTFYLWQSVQTQWRIDSVGSATGLDYAGIQACMAMRGIRKKDQSELFDRLQVMERAALDEWDKQK